ncbi:Protein of unknown function DUF810 [Cinnamomum micranthum f. kanehirae]|uniref:Uncharacterized protein n=1 Tax=Cinnamomum micranthum f. kanehirae TaxID=337451 RepID=A0A3S3NCB8_9MAGN|nr:Protein of unknown function DUF810 [Cinnamomum micranthum f. kanehirae]
MDNNDQDSLLTPTLSMSRKVDVDRNDLRETAYEIFSTSCRSSLGFGEKNALNYYPTWTIFFTSCRSSLGFGEKNALNYYPTWTARDREGAKEGGECTSPKSSAMSTMVPSTRIKRARTDTFRFGFEHGLFKDGGG